MRIDRRRQGLYNKRSRGVGRRRRTIVLGLDGASFELIGPWLDRDLLPNLKMMIENGAYGNLESSLPPVTCPNWKCYSTGKNPGKLGVYWWEVIDVRNRQISIASSKYFPSREFWDYLIQSGKKVGVLNLPMSYPPRKVGCFYVAGGPDSGDKGFAYPPSFEKYLKKIGYNVHPRIDLASASDFVRGLADILELIRSRFDVLVEQVSKASFDFLHMTIFYINVIHHFLWDSHETTEAWKLIDRCVGKLLEVAPKEANIFVMSDHGSNKIVTTFYVNEWLRREGYLSYRSSVSDIFLRLGLNREKLVGLLGKLRLNSSAIRRVIPSFIEYTIPSDRSIDRSGKAHIVDWDKTRALASGQGPVYLTTEKNSAEYEMLRKELIEKLEGIRSPFNGERLIKKAHKSEHIYHGNRMMNAPDILLEQSPGCHIEGGMGNIPVFERPHRWQAENKTEGLFIAYGPDIQKGIQVRNLRIVDLAPTILHLHGVAVPSDMDGRVLKEIFAPGSHAAYGRIWTKEERSEIGSLRPTIARLRRELEHAERKHSPPIG